MKTKYRVLGVALGLACLGWTAAGQQTAPPAVRAGDESVRTFYLTNISQAADANEITTAVRNLLTPEAKIYFVLSQNALIVRAAPDQLALAQRLLNDLDRPKKTYRLTYTVTEVEGGKRVGTQHFTLLVVSGQRTVLKEGSRVPIVTGSYSSGTSSTQTQFTYLDVGLNFDATLDESVNGVRLRTKAEQSSIAEEKSGLGPQDPVVRQTVLEGTAILTPGKPVVLGSLDIPGSPRHMDIDVAMDVVH